MQQLRQVVAQPPALQAQPPPPPPPVEQDTRESAKMLVILENGEQRLITFTLPKESCTVQELLEQVGVPFTPDTNIQCLPNPGIDIDYLVTVGIPFPGTPAEIISAAQNSLQLKQQEPHQNQMHQDQLQMQQQQQLQLQHQQQQQVRTHRNKNVRSFNYIINLISF